MNFIFLLITIVLLVVIVIGGILLWYNDNENVEPTSYLEMKEILTYDAHLNRLLMIEIINNRQNDKLKSEIITFEKMNSNISSISKVLMDSFGSTITNKIITLFQRRNEILREYYMSMKNIICNENNCVHIVNDDSKPNNFPSTLFGLEIKDGVSIESLDITTATNRKLEAIAREITDSIATSFNIRDVDQTFSKKRPTLHYQRLYNLIVMYDKELLNQAKSYTSNNYKISMDCGQSSLEIVSHLYDELSILMKQNKTVSVR
jgi:hypothetical protein